MFGRETGNYLAPSTSGHEPHPQSKHKEISRIPIFIRGEMNRNVSRRSNSSQRQQHCQLDSAGLFQQQLENLKGKGHSSFLKPGGSPLLSLRKCYQFGGQENSSNHNPFSKPKPRQPQLVHKTRSSTASVVSEIKLEQSVSFRAPGKDCFEYFFTKQFSAAAKQKAVLRIQLQTMIQRATGEYMKAHPNSYKALTKHTVDSMHFFCSYLEVNNSTMYRAIELYDRFVIRFNDEMYESTLRMDTTEKDSVRQRIEAQGPLRMCTCILLASKLHSDIQTSNVTTNRVKEMLQTAGYTFRKEAVVKSEIRVMTTLNFRLHWITPFELVENILSLLHLTKTVLPKVYHYCMVILEFCYQTHHEIYRQLWNTNPSRSTQSTEGERTEFKYKVEYNTPLRSASIVSCALLIVKPDSTRRFCKELAEITTLCETDINDLAALILNLILT